ncbi:MAG: hypothetical protein IT432_04890 [Phycisphaerales bacterium]|nr:hypothetical protein [Phycisphaerales bacterium]
MVDRRTLTEGLKATPPPIDTSKERDFVFAGKEPPTNGGAAALGRTPISTRVRADFALLLKRASLERQLKAIEPHTLQDILEQAIEPWLKSNGYLS